MLLARAGTAAYWEYAAAQQSHVPRAREDNRSGRESRNAQRSEFAVEFRRDFGDVCFFEGELGSLEGTDMTL